MATVNTISKQPYKLIEIPLNKFHQDVVPYHNALYKNHKTNVNKLLNSNNIQQVHRELNDIKLIVRQLKNLMYELDTLRTQVEDADLGKFDSSTVSIRKTILELTRNYSEINKEASYFVNNYVEKVSENDKSQQVQIQEVEAKNLESEALRYKRVESLRKDIEDVHEIFNDLNVIVNNQAEHVDKIEDNTESAATNIRGGLKELIKASKLKRASYPVAGAFIGTVVGGPIGSVAGFKIGGLAAISCGLIGYVSGKFITKTGHVEVPAEIMIDSNTSNDNTYTNIKNIDDKKVT